MITADTITDEQIRHLQTWALSADDAAVAWFALHGTTHAGRRERARARCAEILNFRAHATTIETETRGEPVGNTEHHIYHRWSCSCGAVGPWGHSLWAKTSLASVEQSAQSHVRDALHTEGK